MALHTLWERITLSYFGVLISMDEKFIKVYWEEFIIDSHGANSKLDLRANLFQQKENDT